MNVFLLSEYEITTTMSHLPQITISKAPKPTKSLSMCRSCSTHIQVGKLRMQVSYPTKMVMYHERTGTPSLFLHLECFLHSPVTYVEEGRDAWKKWESCDPYQVKTLLGLETFSNDERKEIEGKFK